MTTPHGDKARRARRARRHVRSGQAYAAARPGSDVTIVLLAEDPSPQEPGPRLPSPREPGPRVNVRFAALSLDIAGLFRDHAHAAEHLGPIVRKLADDELISKPAYFLTEDRSIVTFTLYIRVADGESPEDLALQRLRSLD